MASAQTSTVVAGKGPGGPGGWERQRAAAARVAHLATVRPDGRPHVVPVTFALAGDVVVTAVDAKPKRSTDLQRLRNVAAQPAVSLLVDGWDEDWARLWWVRLDGTARTVEDPHARTQHLVPLVAKYRQYRDAPPQGPVLVVALTSWTSWAATAPGQPPDDAQ